MAPAMYMELGMRRRWITYGGTERNLGPAGVSSYIERRILLPSYEVLLRHEYLFLSRKSQIYKMRQETSEHPGLKVHAIRSKPLNNMIPCITSIIQSEGVNMAWGPEFGQETVSLFQLHCGYKPNFKGGKQFIFSLCFH